MTSRIYDSAAYRWKIPRIYTWSTSRSRWEEQIGGNPKPGMARSSIFTPYLGEGTIWKRDVTSMPLHPQSATMAAWMWSETPTRYKTYTGTASGAFGSKTSLNTSVQNTGPIATCVVDSTDPNCHFQYMDTVAGPTMTTAELDAMLKGAIPWPYGFVPSTGGDKGIAIFDLGTGITREYFGATPVAGKPGHWTATVGGYSVAEPHFPNGPGFDYATHLKGSNAVVKMHNSLGFIGIDDVRRGVIDHAVSFTMANAVADLGSQGGYASYPALASDAKYPPASWSGWTENGGTGNGNYPGPSPRHGQWGRLPITVNPMLNPRTNLPYNPLTRLIIRAAQKYGIVGTDTNAWAHAFNGEFGSAEKAITGVDPWTASGELAQILRPDSPSTAFDVSDFPWDLTEWATFDWGRPNPDFFLRFGEFRAYEPH